MIAMSQLAPKSGSQHKIAIEFTSKNAKNPVDVIFMTNFEFNKDETAAKGAGKIEFYYSNVADLDIKKHDEYLIKAGWEIDGKVNLKEFISGRFSEVEVKSYKITASIEDYGYKLEEKASVTYTQKKRSAIMRDIITKKAGMKAYIDFGSQPDDVIDFTSVQSTSDASTGGSGLCLNALCGCGLGYAKTGTHCWVNKCGYCGKATLHISTKTCAECANNQITCSSCDTDFCGQHGNSLEGSRKYHLQPAGGSTAGTATATAAAVPQVKDSTATDTSATSGTGANTPATASSPSSSGMAYWDMLLTLADPAKVDLEIFVWLDTVYVLAIPSENNPALQITGTDNLVYDTIDLKEGDPTITNVVKVQYGTGKTYNMAVAQDKDAVDKYGETLPLTIKGDKLNSTEALALAETNLGKVRRDAGLELDCTVIGGPDWYICRWARVYSAKYDVERTMYIGRVDHKMAPGSPWTVDLATFEYRPTIKAQSAAAGGTGSGAYGSTVSQIIKWVHDNIKYSYYYNCHKTPQQTLSEKSGNCCDKAALAIYLIQQTIPNPPTMSLNCHKVCNGIGHCNIDMTLNGQQVVADPTCTYLNQV